MTDFWAGFLTFGLTLALTNPLIFILYKTAYYTPWLSFWLFGLGALSLGFGIGLGVSR